MAKTLKELPDSTASRKPLGKSPLDKYLDGQIWELTMEDARQLEREMGYAVGTIYRNTGSLRYAFYARAKVAGVKVHTRVFEDRFIVQSYKLDGE